MKKTDKNLCPHRAYTLVRADREYTIKYTVCAKEKMEIRFQDRDRGLGHEEEVTI